MQLNDLASAFRRSWLVALAVFAIFVGVGVAAAYVPVERYRATATLLVQPRAGAAADFSSVGAVQFLLPSLAEQVKTETFHNAVERRLDPRFSAAGVALDSNVEPGTGILRISAESTDPATAEAVANAAARELVRRKATAVMSVSVLDQAHQPASPASPRRKALLAGATVLGLIAAFFAALGATRLRKRFGSIEEIQQQAGLEVLAEIPSGRRFPATASALFAEGDHRETVEAYRRLRTNVAIGLNGSLPAIAITSCAQGEGKSTVTANLAWALASIGYPVLAVDCDLRRPSLHEHFGLELGRGVGDLDHGAKLSSVVKRTELPSLKVISAGHAERHPSEVLHAVLPQVLGSFTGHLILIDTPPMLEVAEATLVATMTKKVMLVVDPRDRTPAEVDRVLHELRRANVEVLGAIANRTRSSRALRASPYYAV